MLSSAVLVLAASMATGQAEKPSSVLPETVSNELQYFVGRWNSEGTIASGEPVKGTLSLEWSSERHCLVGNFRVQLGSESFGGNAIWGWDSASQELVWTAFYSNNALEINRQKIESPGVLRGQFSGSVKGTPYSARGETDRKGPGEWTFVTKGFVAGGEKKGEFSVRFVRVAKDRKKAK